MIFAVLLAFGASLNAIDRPQPPAPAGEVAVTLIGRAADLAIETVNFGLPLPPGFLDDSRRVRIISAAGDEIEAAVRPLEPWRIDGKDGSIRSLQVQFQADFRREKIQQVKAIFGDVRRKDAGRFLPVAETLVEPSGLKGPRVLAVLPAQWLCDSWVVGPQVAVMDAGADSPYDRLVEKNFPGSLQYIDSPKYDHWLFDRTTCWYKMYVRSGERRYLEAAYQAAHFVRTHTKMEPPNAGMFVLKKGLDIKYVYPRAMHIHYLLTGDERALETGKVMAKLLAERWDPVYRGGFWTPRHEGYGWLGVLHGWELTGSRVYWEKARAYADALYQHQRQPRDGRPPDGSFRQNWAEYSASESTFTGATSAWMMAILLDPMFHYWTLTGDRRIPGMVLGWVDFLDRKGLQPDGRSAYYVINCFAGEPGEQPSTLGGDMTRHNTEMAYQFAMGVYFSQDAQQRARYRERSRMLLSEVMEKDLNATPRAFNWAFQASSQLVYFLQHPGGR